MSNWQAIIFDLDDTLYPERDFIRSGFRSVAAWTQIHVGVPQDEAYKELCGLLDEGRRGNTFDCWLQRRGMDTSHVPEMVAVYRQHSPRIRPFAEVPGLLGRLREGASLGVVSDGYLDIQERKLAALGLASLLNAVVFSDQWGREFWKPHVRPFETVLSRLAVASRNAVYVADNPAKDFVGARRLGMATVRVRLGGIYDHVQPPSPDHAPEHEVTNFEDLKRLLLGNRC